jgi:hypothetical protein
MNFCPRGRGGRYFFVRRRAKRKKLVPFYVSPESFEFFLPPKVIKKRKFPGQEPAGIMPVLFILKSGIPKTNNESH